MSLTEHGYSRPTYEEILEDKIQLAKDLFGEDIETDEKTPLGKFIRIGAYDLSKAYEDVENVYYARFPNTARGVSLDRLCVFVGISRNPATYAEHEIPVNGHADTAVEENIVCGENPEIVFHNIAPFVLDENGMAVITVECETIGTEGNGIVINEIVNPISGVDGVSGCSQITLADDTETDYDLRRRFAQTVEGVGGSSLQAIIAAVLKVATVKSVSVVENDSNETDIDGRPPHSFETYVYGGEDKGAEIAQAIFGVKPLGIQTVGSTSVTIKDVSGDEQVIYFSPATNIQILVRMQIKTDDTFPADGISQIQTNVADRINNLGLGESLILSTLYECAYRIGGVTEVRLLEVSTDGGEEYNTSNVVLSAYNVAICSGTSIEVVS